MKSLVLVGRRWFDRKNGNTYHTVEILVEGEPLYKAPIAYGYGDQYVQTAQEWLDSKGRLPGLKHYSNNCHQPLWDYCQEHKIKFHQTVSDVGRKKDL